MAVKTYTEAELKTLVLNTFSRLRFVPSGTAILSTDIDDAYDFATAQLGYDVPVSGDENKGEKIIWLVNRIEAYIYGLLLRSYDTATNIKDNKTRQIWEGWKKIRDGLEKVFKEDYITPLSGTMVRSSGFVYNEYGEDLSYEKLEEIDRESGTVKGIDD